SLVRQSPLEAQSLSSTKSVPLDLITQTSITPDRPILTPERMQRVKLRLSGINLSNFPLMNVGRQRLNQDQLEIKREDITHLGFIELPVRQRLLDPFIQPTVFLQSDHPKISQLAAEIVRGERDARKAVLRIKNWVYKEIAKEPTVSIPNALEVLQTKKGDCNEHTVLFNAIARAAGIPAKTVVGVVYLRGAFYYHAWSEVWIGEWISVDSVLNQFPADATHIKFLEGEIDRQMDVLQLIGNLKIQIIEAS
ncbi:MAG TPA: transglutaminase-like domain-containing protein, partial [Candidatus Binatia bacterium]